MIKFIILLGIFLLSLFLTSVIRVFSLKKSILDIPNQRSSHQVPVPRGGGLAFVITFYITLILLFFNHFVQPKIFFSLLGGVPIACVGYCDDLFGVKSYWRAIIHLFSAIWGLSFLHEMTPLFFIFATLTTVWFINLYNFMDGIDGLAGMEAVFVGVVSGLILLTQGFHTIAFVSFALAFSVLGFLMLNWSPAKIFMGDVGSGFIGFIFADLMWITNNHHHITFPVWIILLSVFIIDASYTLIYRVIQKKKWWLAHREHAYQKLVQLGFKHKQITLGVFAINVIICIPLAAIYLRFNDVFYLVIDMGIFSLIWFFIRKKYTFSF